MPYQARFPLMVLILAVLLPAAAHGAESPARRPNVVLIISDDQGYGDLACHGNRMIQTPNLDRLSSESVRLTNFHVDPTCAPTRAALMTGRNCARTGVWHTIMGRSILRRDEVTMADAFAASGYRTAMFGKWHLGDSYPYRPHDRGFQTAVYHGGGGVGQTPDYWGNDYFDDTYFRNGTPEKFQGYCTDVWFDEALNFIAQPAAEPFFVYLATNAPHSPFLVDPKYSRPYHEQGVPDPMSKFYGMITNLDENVGRLLARLKELKLEDDTLVIFMTDNGTAAGWGGGKGGRQRGKGAQGEAWRGFNAGMRDGKGSEYDGGHRVPCFLRWQKHLPAGRDVARLTAHVDLLPTLVDLCRLQPLPAAKRDGASLAPLLKNPQADWPDRTLVVDSQRIEQPEKWRKSAVMTDRWRLIRGEELYDIQADPGQTQNIAAAHPQVVAELRDAYEQWWRSVSQRFDEYVPLVVGAPEENPTPLNAMDWHAPQEMIPWNQPMIDSPRQHGNGFWVVEVPRAGRYEIQLRRRPHDVAAPLNAEEARLKIGEVDQTQAVSPQAASAVFTVTLPAGQTRLQTWLDPKSKNAQGAGFVDVRHLSD